MAMSAERFTGTVEAKDFPKMPQEYQDLLLRLFTIQADAEIGGPHLYVDKWLLRAPGADDMWRVARICAEEIDHFRKFNRLLHEIGASADDLLQKDPEDRMVDVFRHSMDKWEDFAVFSFLIDRVGRYQLEEFVGCSYLPVTRILNRIIDEEKGHVGFGEKKLEEMCKTAEGKAKIQVSLDKYYPMALDMFGKSRSPRNERYLYWRIKRRLNEQAREDYLKEVDPLIAGYGLRVPDPNVGRKFL
jgi:ring-1,2-phenylacetyl-CoA epoxidase subunit PaaA